MEMLFPLLATLLFLAILFNGGSVTALMSEDKSEEWGYVEVRPKAHLFWWLYRSPYRVENPSNPWPTILWLQGGPGSSGVGFGNFGEIGPLDINLKPRDFTWLRKADLLFVDNPVGTGYSYVEDSTLYVKTDDEATNDLITLLIELFNSNESLQTSPLFIVAESYGGKIAVKLGLSALKTIQQGKLKVKFGGVVLGDTWISPIDFVFSWGPLLKDLSRLDDNGLQKANSFRYALTEGSDPLLEYIEGNHTLHLLEADFITRPAYGKNPTIVASLAEMIKQQLEAGQFVDATYSWSDLENQISLSSNNVDFYNLLKDSEPDSDTLSEMKLGLYKEVSMMRYSKYLSSMLRSSLGGEEDDLEKLLNGVIRKKLKIIPENVTYVAQSSDAFENLLGDFMKPRITEVDELLALGVNVTIYSGQLDLICATKGTEAWLKKLKWEGLPNFLGKDRTPLYCGSDKSTKGFYKSYKNLNFYWILGAGHFVPTDQPCLALDMLGEITRSPAA